MALDFPSSPIDGQLYGNFIWAASPGVWKAKPSSPTVIVTSPTAPTDPNPGDIWMNSNDGVSFTYYSDGTSSQWIELISSGVPSVIMPLGTIVQTALPAAPTGWLLCQGQAISRVTYSLLFSAVGTLYGVGDGTSTFLLPDLRGRVPVGQASSGIFANLSATGGAETVTLATAQMPSHTHIQNSHNHTQNSHRHSITSIYDDANYNQGTIPNNGQQSIPFDSGTIVRYQYTDYTTATNNAFTATNQNTGGGEAHNNLQPYIVLNYMIKV